MRSLELGSVGAMRRRLNGLVLAGLKQATAGLRSDYGAEPLESLGERLVLVDDDVHRVGVVQVTATEKMQFGQVPWSFALAEHEGHTSIEEWREGHRRFWQSEGQTVTDETPVFLVHFTLVDAS